MLNALLLELMNNPDDLGPMPLIVGGMFVATIIGFIIAIIREYFF